MRICMFVKNSFEYDARVTKEARSLIRAGYAVTVVALHVPGVTARRERTPDGVDVVRVTRLYGRLTELLPGFLSASTVAAGAGRRAAPAPDADATPPGRRAVLARRWSPAVKALVRAVLPVAAAPARLANIAVTNRRMVREGLATRAGVYCAHDLNTLRVAAVCKNRSGGALVYDAHELHTHRSGVGPVRRAVSRWLERRGVRHVDAVVTATASWAELFVRRYGITPPTVVRNLPPRTVVDEPVDLRARLGIPAHARILLYQGSIQANRGIEEALAALPLLPDCVLVVCGYGAHRPALQSLTRAKGLADRVHFDGPVPNDALLAYTAGADVGLCLIRNSSLSYYLSLPNKLFEYVMAGVPTVASDFPEMGAVVRAERVGEVCDPDDPAAVAAAVRRVLDATAGYRAATVAAAARLHWGVDEPGLLAVYDRVAARRT